jgi:hypothetical protein
MTFTPRNYLEITSAMVAYLTAHPDLAPGVLPSDLAVGSLERSHLEALGIMLEEYDHRMADAITSAISESCFEAFGFSRLPAKKAIGSVVFSSLAAVPYEVSIPSGTVLQGPNGALFTTTAGGKIPYSATASDAVPVQANVDGVVGNVAENTITKIVSPIRYVDLVTNPQPTASGGDIESDDARSIRFRAFLSTLPRGTKEALEFAALSTASGRVVDARAIEPFLLNPVPEGVPFAGRVWLFVDDGTPNADIDVSVRNEVYSAVNGYVDAAGNQIAGYKSAGVNVDIVKVARTPVKVRAKVKLASGAVSRWTEIQANLTAAAVAYFESLRVAESSSYQNLVTVLTNSDQDLREVTLVYWKDGSAVPGYSDPIVAADITPYDAASPYSAGARLSLAQNASYPEWILVD